MGNLLGAPPTASGATPDVSDSDSLPPLVRVEIDSVQLAAATEQLAGLAIDVPQAGQSFPGPAVDIGGWVIGRDEPVRGVSVVSDSGDVWDTPVEILRQDVAAAFPDIPHGARSGFWTRVPLPRDEELHRLTVTALPENTGPPVALAHIDARARQVARTVPPGWRAVRAPDVVIIGAQRGGTTSLYSYLSAHPDFAPAAMKETHFLADYFGLGVDWYLAQFPVAVPPGSVTGEATPYALFHPHAPHRLRAIAPRAKLIVLLRNPVERAYSHYLLESSRGDEELDFAAAIAAEPARLAGEEARLVDDATAVSYAHKHHSYLARGDYAPQLARWFDAFPRDQFLLLRSEDLYERPADVFARVADFLGIATDAVTAFARHNSSSGPPLDPVLRQRLAAYFAPRNDALCDLLGWDPGWD